uniref:Microspherule protein 1 n=1 Tax=Chelydra serpentina TaxID=8475 RepID=A0A8C3XPZ1_CHESE
MELTRAPGVPSLPPGGESGRGRRSAPSAQGRKGRLRRASCWVSSVPVPPGERCRVGAALAWPGAPGTCAVGPGSFPAAQTRRLPNGVARTEIPGGRCLGLEPPGSHCRLGVQPGSRSPGLACPLVVVSGSCRDPSVHPQTSQPTLDTFQDLLDKHPEAFYPSRSAKALQVHWQLMKQYYLLDDQTVQPLPKGDQVLNFSDAEDMIDDSKLKDVRDEVLEHELTVADRRQKREIRQLEQELHKWQVLVDSITGMSSPDFDNQTLAVLRGRMVRYLMRSREITLGRATKDNQIDVDLALEGPAWKISRKQGVIKLKNNGDFFIANEGRRPVYVDGRPVLGGSKWKLSNNSVVEIASLRFVFLINQDLIALIKAEAAKIPQP